MSVQAWVHFEGAESNVQRIVLAALVREGVAAEPLDLAAPKNPCLLIFVALSASVLRLLRMLSRNGSDWVLAIAAPGTTARRDDIESLLAAGASHAFVWDEEPQPAREARARLERWNTVDAAVSVARKRLVGASSPWMKFLRELVEAAHFSTAPVLIQGEPGTGKTLAAHVLHDLQPRLPKGAFVRFDSTQVIESLSVSDLAGHIRGAFTGAITDHKGMLAAASGGTLFFDEVGDLPLPIQAQLLIAIEEKRFRPVGTTEWRETDFRPLFATNRKLLALVEAGQFRKDLYQRVAGQVLFVPPLGERREDILSLARHFVDEGDPRPQTPDIHPALGEFLTQRSYPGNVRELKQLVGRILAQHVGSRSLKLGDIPADERQSLSRSRDDWQDDRLDDVVRRALSQGASLGAICQAVRGAAFRCALDLEKNDVRRAASRLAVSRRTIQRHCAVWRQPEHETST